MSDELKRILIMVEEKKISAEEAEKLINALQTGRKRHEGIFNILNDVGQHLKGLKDYAGKKDLKFGAKDRLDIKGLSGDVMITGKDTETIAISCDGFVKTTEDKKSLSIKGMSGDISVNVPKKTKISLATASGDIDIGDIEGELLVKGTAGDISIDNFRGKFELKGAFGDIHLDFAHLEDGRIKTAFGDMEVGINPDDDIDIEVNLKKGKILNEMDLEVQEVKDTYLKARLNKGKKSLRINGAGGIVRIKGR